jgi:hypothetical protein
MFTSDLMQEIRRIELTHDTPCEQSSGRGEGIEAGEIAPVLEE